MTDEVKILFSCVSAEVVMVLEPIKKLNPDEVHIFRYLDPKHAKTHHFSGDCFEEVRRFITHEMPWIKLFIHDDSPVYEPVALFRSLYNTLGEVHRRRKDVPVHFNISSGPHEFALTTGWITMFDGLVNIYSVHSRGFCFPEDVLMKYAYVDGRPVGMSKAVSDPKFLVKPTMFELRIDMIRALEQFRLQHEYERNVDNCSMMRRLVWAGISDYDLENEKGEPGYSKKVSMYYMRHYLDYWKVYGWVEKKEKPNGQLEQHYSLTENGERILEMFRKD